MYDIKNDRGLELLSDIGHRLSSVHSDDLDVALKYSAKRAADFAQYQRGRISLENCAHGYPLIAPGIDKKPSGTLILEGKSENSQTLTERDEQILNILTQLIAATIVRVKQEEEKDALHIAIKKREERLEHVVERLFTVQEEERRKVSAELHDSVAQTASALYRRLEVLASKVDSKSSEEMELASVAKGLVSELRQIIAGLRPTVLDDLGLAAAINALADRLRVEGYQVIFRAEVPPSWPKNTITAFYRVAQEAVNNVLKHAGGVCRVDISLLGDAEKGVWSLDVRDYGGGAKLQSNREPDQRGQHIGLEVMQERMLAIGGNLKIVDLADEGFLVEAKVEDGANDEPL